MTQKQKEMLRKAASECMSDVSSAILFILNDEPREALATLRDLWDRLQSLEGKVGCYTPLSLFE